MRDVAHLVTPLPVTNCHTFLDPLPLERDVLYGRPHTCVSCASVKESMLLAVPEGGLFCR